MKKVLVVLLSTILIIGLVGCGKKEAPIDETNETETNEVVSMDSEENKTETESKVGEWEIVNLPFDQASQDVKDTFNRAMESVQEELIPTRFLGSQIVSGTNYAFLTTDNVNAERYVYIYKNAKGEIEKIEISKPNEKLEILPNEQIDKVMETAQTENQENENNNSETESNQETQSAVDNHNNSSANTTQNSTNNENNNSNNSNSNGTSEEKPNYKNAEEALIGIYGSKEAACSALNENGLMDIQLKENNIIYSYTYQEELSDEKIKFMKDEILQAMEGPAVETQKSFITDLETKGNISGVKVIVKYFEKTGKEIVTIEFDKNGMK